MSDVTGGPDAADGNSGAADMRSPSGQTSGGEVSGGEVGGGDVDGGAAPVPVTAPVTAEVPAAVPAGEVPPPPGAPEATTAVPVAAVPVAPAASETGGRSRWLTGALAGLVVLVLLGAGFGIGRWTDGGEGRDLRFRSGEGFRGPFGPDTRGGERGNQNGGGFPGPRFRPGLNGPNSNGPGFNGPGNGFGPGSGNRRGIVPGQNPSTAPATPATPSTTQPGSTLQ